MDKIPAWVKAIGWGIILIVFVLAVVAVLKADIGVNATQGFHANQGLFK